MHSSLRVWPDILDGFKERRCFTASTEPGCKWIDELFADPAIILILVFLKNILNKLIVVI
jgi:hypothetical protein